MLIVNNFEDVLTLLRREVHEAGIGLTVVGERIYLEGPAGKSCLRIVRLYRPSSADVEREGAPDVLLVLMGATRKAISAAKNYNHISIPQGGYRLIAPGVVLIHECNSEAELFPVASRQVRLMGRTGVVAESLLLDSKKRWSVHELALIAQVSPSLAHRVMVRLEQEGLLVTQGKGREKLRVLTNPKALAELWSDEEHLPTSIVRGFLYNSSLETLARKILELYPGGAIGGVLAANLYKPVLTRVMPPIRIWTGSDFDPNILTAIGFEKTDEGVNIEFVRAKNDPWRIHRQNGEIPKVSKWRAWLEITGVKGRTEELAKALLTELEGNQNGSH